MLKKLGLSPLSSTSSTKAILKFLVMVVVAACGLGGGGCCGVCEHLFEAGRLFILPIGWTVIRGLALIID